MLRLALGSAVLALLSGVAVADPCQVSIEATDRMQFSERVLTVPSSCAQIELTLRNTGTLPARIMGHDWVLTREADAGAVAAAGQAAGFDHNYQPVGDARVLAATPVIGGGTSTTIRIDVAMLQRGQSYTYFCSTPGHASMMRGKLQFGTPGELQAGNRKS
jgi:azurin